MCIFPQLAFLSLCCHTSLSPGYGGYGLGGYGGYGLGYGGYGLSRVSYGGYGGHLWKRDAEAEAEPSIGNYVADKFSLQIRCTYLKFLVIRSHCQKFYKISIHAHSCVIQI